MTFTLTTRTLGIAGGVLALALLAVLLFHTSLAPYSNNFFKKHRWASETCIAAGRAGSDCALQWKAEKVSTETAYYDICLEHGELRRIK